jgi:Fic family protein
MSATEKKKAQLKALKEKKGTIQPELLEKTKQARKQKKLIATCLENSASDASKRKTVDEISAETGLDKPTITYYLAGFRKYRLAVETNEFVGEFEQVPKWALTADKIKV